MRSRVPALQRSILPTVPGVPAWSAVLVAIGCTLLGFLLDASGDNTELTATFSTLYVVGCVAAALAVRMRGLFTTMVLPPLLLFFAVPLAYRQLSGGGSGLKDILLNLAIPLVNRFPTMMIATVLVWAIGAYRTVAYRKETGRGTADRGAASRAGTKRGAAKRGGTKHGDAKRGDAERGDAKRGQAERPAGRSRGTDKRPLRAQDEPGGKPAGRRKVKPPRSQSVEDMVTDKYEAPQLGRRPSKEVADTPPRVGGRPPREGRPTARSTAARATAARAEPEPTRGRTRGATPPHPQANVRYRDRDAGRPRRKPESL